MLVAAAALAYRSWWQSERSRSDRQVVLDRLGSVAQRQDSLGAVVQELESRTRMRLDSVRDWMAREAETLAARDARAAGATDETVEDRARRLWKEALRALPQDLNAYERLVAEQELKETLAKRFDLTKAQLKAVTSGA